MNTYSVEFLKQAHKGSISHKEELLSSSLCGCFYCQETFTPSEIEEWIEEPILKGETALCPKCGIDSVLSNAFPISDESFLKEMNAFWF